MPFDLVDLRLFARVAEAGSITAGAQRANMALASASERIRGMEEALGVALLERGRRGISLTPAGTTLAHHARIITQQLGQMREELAAHAKGFKGYVRMASNTSAMSEFLPEALDTFLATHPGIDIDLEERASYDIVRAVATGAVDAGIVADIVDFAGLETYPFATDRLVVVLSRDHPFAGRRSLSFADLLDEAFVGLGAASALQHHLARRAAQAGRALKLRVRLNGFDAICRMVGSGVGLAVVPEMAARRCRKALAIRIVRLADPWALRHLSICVRRLDGLTAPAQQLVQHLRGWRHEAASPSRTRS